MIQTLAAASMVAVLMPNTFPSCSKSAAERRDSTPAGRFSQRKHFGDRAPHKCACFKWIRSQPDVSCQMACCTMCNVHVSTAKLPNDSLAELRFVSLVIASSEFDIALKAI